MARLKHYRTLISWILRVLHLQLKLERILKCHKLKQILGEIDRRLCLLDPNGYGNEALLII